MLIFNCLIADNPCMNNLQEVLIPEESKIMIIFANRTIFVCYKTKEKQKICKKMCVSTVIRNFKTKGLIIFKIVKYLPIVISATLLFI